jgi:hypothetical protein
MAESVIKALSSKSFENARACQNTWTLCERCRFAEVEVRAVMFGANVLKANHWQEVDG